MWVSVTVMGVGTRDRLWVEDIDIMSALPWPPRPPSAPPDPPHAPEEQVVGEVALVFAGTLVLVLLGSHCVLRTHCVLLPESSVAIIIGVLVGLILRVQSSGPVHNMLQDFNTEIFFYVLLPPIIFEAGYSLKRRLFMANVVPIVTFAILGVVVSSGVMFGVLQAGGALGWVEPSVFADPGGPPPPSGPRAPEGINTGTGVVYTILFSLLISATDAVASLAVLSSSEVNADPNLQSIIFGESVLNDPIVIVIFKIVESVATRGDGGGSGGGDGGGDGGGSSAAGVGLLFVGKFLEVSIGSTGIGLACSLVISLILRHGTLYEASSHIEVALTIGCGYVAYALGEACELSGILALFACAVALGHYNWYNLSDTAKLITAHVAKTISYLAEQSVFVYLGMCAADSSAWEHFHGAFTLLATVGAAVGRVVMVALLAQLLNCCAAPSQRLTLPMQCLIAFAGLRGAVCFALALRFPADPVAHSTVVSATIVIVVASTLLLGGLTAPLVRALGVGRGGSARDTTGDAEPRLGSSQLSHRLMSEGGGQGSLGALHPQNVGGRAIVAAPRAPRSRFHAAWRRFDRRYLQYLFGGAASASARRQQQQQQLTVPELSLWSFRSGGFGSTASRAGGSQGPLAAGGGGSGSGGGGGSGCALAPASPPRPDGHSRADPPDVSDDGSEGSDVEAEREAAEGIMLMVRANTADRFLVRRTPSARSASSYRAGSGVHASRSAAHVIDHQER